MFMLRRSASVGDRSPWGDFWFQPVGIRSGAGVRVDADSAMRLSAVYACVRVLAESFAVLPFVLYRPKFGGGSVRITDHWLYRLFARQPNRFQTPFEWREMLQGHLALRGNAFCQIVDDGAGGIAELQPLHPDRVKIEMLDNGSWRYRYTDGTGNLQYFNRNQIWHLRGLSGDGIAGMSPIDLARETIGGGLAAQDYGSRFFANDAKPTGGWIEFPGKFADLEARRVFRESWQTMQGGANRGKTALLDQGMKYHEIGVSNKDSQFLESRQFTISDVARVFRIPPHLVGDLSGATFSNIEQQSLEFVTHTMTPWAERWESSIECMLLGPDQDLEVEFDFSVLLRGDAAGRGAFYHGGIMDGWLTRNEAREREGLDPIDGLDEPLRPLNMVEESSAEVDDPADANDANTAATGGADDGAAADPDSGEPQDDAQAGRMQRLLRGNAERLARRIHGALSAAGMQPGGPKAPVPADVVADAIAVSHERAAAWIASAAWNGPHDEIVASLMALGETV